MRPARQGTFDGLCGVYAILNALDLVGLRQPRGRLHEDLFKQLTYGLGAVALLAAMREGLEPEELLPAADLAFRWLESTHGVCLSMTQPYLDEDFPTTRHFIKALEGHCHSADSAAIISFKTPGVSHWTVPIAVHGKQLRLRDSGGHSELNIPDFHLQRGTHQFRVADTLVITCDDGA